MIFDTLEKMLAGVLAQASRINHPLKTVFAEVAIRGVKTLREYPTFRLYDHRELVNKINEVGIDSDEQKMIRTHLPYDEFAVVVHNVGTVFFWRGSVLPEEYNGPDYGKTIYSIATIHHGDDAQDDYEFFGPVMMLQQDNGQLDLWTPYPPDLGEDEKADLYKESEKTMNTAVTLLNILSVCRNQVVACKTPDGLKKKRAKHGKYPQYEYKILTLDATAVKQLPTAQRELVTGRLSPRTHTRRGHVRHYPGGKVTWVRSSIINAPYYADGVIVKDYDVIGS